MYIKDIFLKKSPVLSFEVFPPKKESGFEAVQRAVEEMSAQPIDYMSVTYGAGGGTSKSTAQIAGYMEQQLSTTALAHLTCVNAFKEDILEKLHTFSQNGVKNILALRGDPPADNNKNPYRDFHHASELTAFIKAHGDFCVGGACYPECHPDSPSLRSDIENLKIKIDAGCDFLVTQMFFDNDAFYDFRYKALKAGINVPITAGIMPLTNAAQIQKMCVLSGGAAMPAKFTRMIAKYIDNPAALKQAGIAYAVDQIIDLLSNDVEGIHLYTMNKPDVADKIVSVIRHLF